MYQMLAYFKGKRFVNPTCTSTFGLPTAVDFSLFNANIQGLDCWLNEEQPFMLLLVCFFSALQSFCLTLLLFLSVWWNHVCKCLSTWIWIIFVVQNFSVLELCAGNFKHAEFVTACLTVLKIGPHESLWGENLQPTFPHVWH